MTDLTIGEYYAWADKRVKLLATGVVLKNYQHKGVQVETTIGFTKQLMTIPAREIASTWENYQKAHAEWDREEQIKIDKLRQMRDAVHELQEIMEKLELYDPLWMKLTAYHNWIMLSFDNAEHAQNLARILQELFNFREECN